MEAYKKRVIAEKKELDERATKLSSADLEAELRDAWKIIDILYMDALDNNGESWPRAREWQERNHRFSPQNDKDLARRALDSE